MLLLPSVQIDVHSAGLEADGVFTKGRKLKQACENVVLHDTLENWAVILLLVKLVEVDKFVLSYLDLIHCLVCTNHTRGLDLMNNRPVHVPADLLHDEDAVGAACQNDFASEDIDLV